MGIDTGREPHDGTPESSPNTANGVEHGRDQLVGDYANDVGDNMNVAKGETRRTYAFSIKDAGGNIRLQSTARNFTDMSMVIEVWKMRRAEGAKDQGAVANAALPSE